MEKELFIKEPLPGDTVKVYKKDYSVSFGIVVGLDMRKCERKIKKKRHGKNVKDADGNQVYVKQTYMRQIALLKKTDKETDPFFCDFCLDFKKVEFVC